MVGAVPQRAQRSSTGVAHARNCHARACPGRTALAPASGCTVARARRALMRPASRTRPYRRALVLQTWRDRTKSRPRLLSRQTMECAQSSVRVLGITSASTHARKFLARIRQLLRGLLQWWPAQHNLQSVIAPLSVILRHSSINAAPCALRRTHARCDGEMTRVRTFLKCACRGSMALRQCFEQAAPFVRWHPQT